MPLYFIYAVFGAVVSGGMLVMLWGYLIEQAVAGVVLIASVAFGVYVLRNHNDWFLLRARRISADEMEARPHRYVEAL